MDYKWTALTVTTVGTLMAGIDFRIVTIGLPTIAQQLRAGPEEVVWVSQAFSLALTVGLLLVGRLTDLFGRIKLYNIGFVIMTLGSALCAISVNPYELIAFRIVQGVGGGLLITNSSAIIADASPKSELGTMLGINQTAFRLGNVAGLTLSGLILTVVDWRGLFYVNIPIGIFGTVWAYLRLHEVGTKDPSRKMDWGGFILFSVGLTLILLAITFLSYGLADTLVGYILLMTGVVLLVCFTKLESKVQSPLLDLRLFRIRLFAAGNLAQLLNSLAWAGIILLISFYLQIGLGYTPLQAGLGVLPLDATYMVSSLVAGKLSDRYGSRGLATLGLVLDTLAFLAMYSFGASTQYPEIAGILCVVGIGSGLFIPPNLRAIMGSVPSNRIGIASGFRNTMFNAASTVSYGLVVLLITIGIPYGAFSELLQGATSLAAASPVGTEFFNGIRIAALILAGINMLAIIPSILRGSK